jgi:hypothetical protein
MLRFANQPNTTGTGRLTRDGRDSAGDPIRVEFYDPATNQTVDTDAEVTLSLGIGSARGNLNGATAQAVGGIASFPDLSIDMPGLYTLKASSGDDSDTPLSNGFMVADTVATCDGPDCSFVEAKDGHTYTTTPERAVAGAEWAAAINLPGVRVSCEFAPFDYRDARQPNAIWYSYDDADTRSSKVIEIVIDKALVDQTPDNDPSEYRVCYSSPVRFTDRTGDLARPDPWDDGPSAYFGTTWFTGLLPDCDEHDPVAPCVLKWTDDGGNRVATILTPPGDPFIR